MKPPKNVRIEYIIKLGWHVAFLSITFYINTHKKRKGKIIRFAYHINNKCFKTISYTFIKMILLLKKTFAKNCTYCKIVSKNKEK